MSQSAAPSTIYVRCPTLHSRGDLLNGFFYAHRAALGLEDFYQSTSTNGTTPGVETALPADGAEGEEEVTASSSPRLPSSFPVEVVYVRLSRKPYFLVEWRYPTKKEEEKQKVEDGNPEAVKTEADVKEGNAASAEPRLTPEFLQQLAERTLALGKNDAPECRLLWRDQPVAVSAALPGMTVAAERTKLELRDAQLKTQRVAEKRAREEAETASQRRESQTSGAKAAPAFVPRSVRRR